jgi:DKNYY family
MRLSACPPVAGGPTPGRRVLLKGMLYRVEGGRAQYGAQAIRGAHAESFQVLESPWAKDRARVYFEGCTVSKAVPRSFRVLGAACGCDAKRIFLAYGGHIYASPYAAGDGFLPSSARAIQKDGRHFLVSKHVWLADTLLMRLKLEGASFEALGQGYARDSLRVV